MKIKFDVECWREVIVNHINCEGLSDVKVDELADRLCKNVIGILRQSGFVVERAYGQKVGAFAIVQEATDKERAAFNDAIEGALERLRDEIIAEIKAILQDVDTSNFSPYYGDLDIPQVGNVIYDPEEGVFAHRRAEEDWPFSCGFECCGVAEHAVVVIPQKVLKML